MEFRTSVNVQKSNLTIGHDSKIAMLGSCFAENIGSWLDSLFFDINLNPFGILYNPQSIADAVGNLIDKKVYEKEDLFLANGLYKSYDHHSRYSAPTPEEALELINDSRIGASKALEEADFIMITFGTSWIYQLSDNEGRTVANCHKLPAANFTRRRMTVKEMTELWNPLIARIREINSKAAIIFTVSPIRHIKDTLHGNQLSKSVLLLGVDELVANNENVHYFQSYEIMMDDLRDYRFYADDMVHPSGMALEYIREKFAETWFSKQTLDYVREADKIRKALEHRVLNEGSEEHKRFLTQNISHIENLVNKYHYFTLTKPLRKFEERLKLRF